MGGVDVALSASFAPSDVSDSTTSRVADVLLAFAGTLQPLGITDISRSTGLSKAVVHRIVQELCRAGFVWRNPETRKYQLGASALALSGTANQSVRFRKIGNEFLADLAQRTGETATLSARVGLRRIYVGQVESAQLIRISVQVGSALPLTIGASGPAILAFLPRNELEGALSVPLPPGTNAPTDSTALRDRLRQVVSQGYARSAGERISDATSLAAPVRNRFGEVLGCISIAALTSRLTEARERELADAVIESAADLSTRLAS